MTVPNELLGIALGFVIEGGAILFLSPFWWSAGMLVLGLLVLGLGLTFGLGSSRTRAADATTPDR